MNLYKELQKLKAKQHETHILDASTLDIIENYMVSNSKSDFRMSSGIAVKGTALRESIHADSNHPEVALLDSATTHTILRDHLFFSFIGSQAKVWQVCTMHTIAGGQNFKFREGWATIVLPEGATL